MALFNIKTRIENYKLIIKNAKDSGLSMRLRLFVFFLVFLFTVMLGILIILMANGVFKTGTNEIKILMEHELSDVSKHLYNDFENISVQGVDLAKDLSLNLEKLFNESGITSNQLQENPELLELFLDSEVERLTKALKIARSSGVFMILDATINPKLENSEYSRAGLYIKNMEPNIVNSSFSNIRFLRGPMSIARKNNIYVLPQWDMEFNVKNRDFYFKTIETAKSSNLPISRLYYWNISDTLQENNEPIMLCSIPLIDSNGYVFGVCGFEVSSMLFNLSYFPDNNLYDHIFCMFSKLDKNHIKFSECLISGSYYPFDITDNLLSVRLNKNYFNSYIQNNSTSFLGLHNNISLYTKESPYKDDNWIIAIMMSEQELHHKTSLQNMRTILLLSIMMILGIIGSSLISSRYIKPVINALNLMKESKITPEQKTKIPEIDDLILFLANQDEISDKQNSEFKDVSSSKSDIYNKFVENIDTLSAAEMAVFNLYLKGHTAKEIADILCLSINTIKTHNKRIYMKLNVTSRKELMIFIKMMEEAKAID